MKGYMSQAKLIYLSREVSPASLLRVSAGYCQGALVDGSGMIGT
jgi:hypothetical protein